jgi:Na+-translocating ferredoxin:NAD+ oxidoreductase RnfG subunit
MGTQGDLAARGCRGLAHNINHDRKEEYMKKYALMMVVLVMGLSLAAGVFAQDKAAIQKQVDDIVKAIDGGKTAADFKDAANNKPNYVYIMKKDGMLLVHPSLEGKSLKEAVMPAYEAVSKATPEGNWVQYEWNGAKKNAYVKETKNGEIVGSGY